MDIGRANSLVYAQQHEEVSGGMRLSELSGHEDLIATEPVGAVSQFE